MLCYFAPMEGLTGPVFRQVHHDMFPGVDRYYTPFLAPTQNHKFAPRDLREILPGEGDTVPTVPQLLTKSSGDFLWAEGELRALGFEEVNLNLGCPSATVVAKGKGSGLLADLPRLTELLEGIFAANSLPVSVKTRIGLKDADSWEVLIALYDRFPIAELTVHPRTRTELYSGDIHEDAFALCYAKSCLPLCFNGEIHSAARLRELENRYPKLHACMIGRGLVANPALVREYRGGPSITKSELRAYHDALYAAYAEKFGSHNAMHRMKEVWLCLRAMFADCARYADKIGRSKDADELLYWAGKIFAELDLKT